MTQTFKSNKKIIRRQKLKFGESAELPLKEKINVDQNKKNLEKLTDQIDQWIKSNSNKQ